MPRDYSKGKIYKIEVEGSNDIYIGSTIKLLCQRMAGHRSGYKQWKLGNLKKGYCKSFELFEKFGLENCKIVLIELYPCSCKAELERREGEIQKELLRNGLVNKVIIGRTPKEYYEDNKEDILKYHKLYQEVNKDKISLYQKEYREVNKDIIKKYKKEYHTFNKDKLNEIRNQKIKCVCGCEIAKHYLYKHKLTKKHLDLIKDI
jgi:hypothetical protein